ncbi:unnamed protein product, partial [marine sediment metagenome]
AARPVRAAPTDEKLDYLIEVLTLLVPVLAEVSERQAALIELLEQWLAAQGVPGIPGVEVTVSTPWVAKDPEQIFSYAIRAAGTFYSDKMADWTKGKRILFKVESSLNQAVNIQLIGNVQDSKELATDINGVLPCPANGNISVGLAWDDWHPYVGVKITVATAPTAGILNVWAVIQE